jgi:hypothetical protein
MKITLKLRGRKTHLNCIKCDKKLSQSTRIKINAKYYFLGAWCSRCNIGYTLNKLWRCCLLTDKNEVCNGLLRAMDLSCESFASHKPGKGLFQTIENNANQRVIKFKEFILK